MKKQIEFLQLAMTSGIDLNLVTLAEKIIRLLLLYIIIKPKHHYSTTGGNTESHISIRPSIHGSPVILYVDSDCLSSFQLSFGEGLGTPLGRQFITRLTYSIRQPHRLIFVPAGTYCMTSCKKRNFISVCFCRFLQQAR